MKKAIIIYIIALIGFAQTIAQTEWVVPESEEGKLSKFEFNETTVSTGENLYMTNCRSCHGIPGQNNPVTMNPMPADPATDQIQHNSDGALHYKIQEGRGLMPSFKRVLNTDQVWQVISYLRSFNPDYVQQVAIAAANNRWTNIMIHLTLLSADKKIKAEVTGLEGELRTPVTGADVRLEANRYFGTLQLGDPVLTNEQGIAYFDTPEDLPADPEGNLSLIALLNDQEEFGVVKTDTVLQAGMPFTPVSLRAERAMWNTVRKAPVWLLITYTLGVLAVWGFIFLVLMQLRSIFKLGEEKETNNS